MFALILRGKLPSDALSGALEDTLTAAALAPIAYGPPDVHARFLKEIAHVDYHGTFDLRFWPWFPLPDGEGAEPDAFGDGPDGALLVEAKAGSPLGRRRITRRPRPVALARVALVGLGGEASADDGAGVAVRASFVSGNASRTTRPGTGTARDRNVAFCSSVVARAA